MSEAAREYNLLLQKYNQAMIDATRYRKIRWAQMYGHIPIVGGWQSAVAFDSAIDNLSEGIYHAGS